MNYTWYEGEIVRITCEICFHKFQTKMKVNGSTEQSWCRSCRKIMNETFPGGYGYTVEKMNAAVDKCQIMRPEK